jgi:hypothetical protein
MKYLLIIPALLLFQTAVAQDKKLQGAWDNNKGQLLVFQKDNQAYWIFYSESKRDTFKIKYRTNLKTQPAQLDLTDFQVGPLKGKTLYGIVEWTDKRTIRFDCEPGTTDSVRPKAFNPTQTQTYRKK